MRRWWMMAMAAWIALVAAIGCSSGSAKKRGAEVDLPGDAYFPESITVDAEDELFVSSLGQKMVVKVGAHDATPVVFLTSADGLGNVAGVHADSASQTLYLCSDDATFQTNSQVLSFDLRTGAPKGSFTFPTFAFCNDLTTDASGTLWVADSFGHVFRSTPGTGVLSSWATGALVAPIGTAGLASIGADGIAWDGDTLWIDNLAQAAIVKIPRLANGSAGTPVKIAVSGLVAPDGLRVDGSGTLLVADGAGSIDRIVVTGTTGTLTTLETVDAPSSVVRASDGVWETEGQVGVLFGIAPGPPSLPFKVRRFAN